MGHIAIIPARGGSKRIPRKNIKDFLGKPIIAYSIEAALASEIFDTVMVSTDDKEIAQVARKYGADVPFMRSAETSTDTAATVPVLIEVLSEYAKAGKNYEHGCCIYPCAPFVTSARLKEGMDSLLNSGANSVLPVARFSYPPQRGLVMRENKIAMLHPEHLNSRSQDLEPMYHDAGQFYCFKVSALLTQERLFCQHTLPLILGNMEVQDIDTEEDWRAAEIKYKILKDGLSV